MSLTIRKIEKDDYNEVEVLTREAFWNIYRPGCSEHLVLHNLHKNNKSIEEMVEFIYDRCADDLTEEQIEMVLELQQEFLDSKGLIELEEDDIY